MRSLKIAKELEIILGSIGAAQSIYLSVNAFLERKRTNQNLVLAFFFLAISIRIIKSLLWVSMEQISLVFINLGFAAHSLTGPLLLLYVYLVGGGKKWSPWLLIHAIPAIFLLLYASTLTLDGFWYKGAYSVLLFHQMFYSLLALGLQIFRTLDKRRHGNLLVRKRWQWASILVGGTLLLQTAYFSNYILGATPYLLGPVAYTILIYFAGIFVFRNPEVLHPGKRRSKYRNIHITPEEFARYKQHLMQVMTESEPYLDSDCSLRQVAGLIPVPGYLLSHLINSEFEQNFSDFINSFRIESAKKILSEKNSNTLKIASIAYDCGFNSLSSFNKSFKKFTGVTPSHFRKKHTDL